MGGGGLLVADAADELGELLQVELVVVIGVKPGEDRARLRRRRREGVRKGEGWRVGGWAVAWAVVTCCVSASRLSAFRARLSSLVLMYPDWSRSCIAKILCASNSSDACDGAADGAAPAAPAPPDPAAPTPLCRCNSATSARNSANWREPSVSPSALANWRSSDIGGESCGRFSAAVTSNMLSTPSPLRSNSPNAAFNVSTWCCGGGGGGAAGDGAKVYASDARRALLGERRQRGRRRLARALPQRDHRLLRVLAPLERELGGGGGARGGDRRHGEVGILAALRIVRRLREHRAAPFAAVFRRLLPVQLHARTCRRVEALVCGERAVLGGARHAVRVRLSGLLRCVALGDVVRRRAARRARRRHVRRPQRSGGAADSTKRAAPATAAPRGRARR